MITTEQQPVSKAFTKKKPRRILRIDASVRTAGSHSRSLADYFGQQWLEKNPSDIFVHRNPASIPHISAETVAGFFTPADRMTGELLAATAISDELIAELRSADILLLSTPIYNFGVPSALKAWIDHIVRIGWTVARDGDRFVGLVKGKQAVVICAYGADGYGVADASGTGPLASVEHLASYLKLLLGFIGITDTEIIAVEGTSGTPEALAKNTGTALRKIESLVSTMA